MYNHVNYDDVYAVYEGGQSLPVETMAEWSRLFAKHGPRQRPVQSLDLGCGAGRFSVLLADTFHGEVLAIDPSQRMLDLARTVRPHPLVRYEHGQAQRIPSAADSFDMILMFQILQHVPNLRKAAVEAYRVLRADGRLLIHNIFADRPHRAPWAAYFPEAFALQEASLPTMDDTAQTFVSAGLTLLLSDSHPLLVAETKSSFLERLSQRAISYLRLIDDAQFKTGLERLAREVNAGGGQEPVLAVWDYLVFGK